MKNKFQSGFTLIESLVAITLVILAITGSYAAAQNGVTTGIFTKDQITAFYLAQEGIEQLRNRRDANRLSSAPNWLSNITFDGGPCATGPCKIDSINNQITSCSADGNGLCTEYLLQDASGFYGYSGGTATRFRRTVTVTVLNANEAYVSSRVDWSKGLVNKYFIAKEYLMNWQ